MEPVFDENFDWSAYDEATLMSPLSVVTLREGPVKRLLPITLPFSVLIEMSP